MTTNQVKQIIDLRKSGCAYRTIADMVGCSVSSVSDHLKQAGLVDPNRNERLKSKSAKMLHDWQTGLSGTKMARKYGYKSRCGVYATITYLRGKGWGFSYRNKGAGQDRRVK